MRIACVLGVLGMATGCCLSTGDTGTAGSGGATSGATGTTGGNTGTGTGTGGSRNCEGVGNGNACSSLADGAPVINLTQVASAPPNPGGGPVPPDGIYYLTSASTYTGSGGAQGKTGQSLQVTLQLSASGTELVLVAESDGCLNTSTGSVSLQGTQVMLSLTCPATQGGRTGYTSTPNTFTLFVPGPMSPEGPTSPQVQVYTLQP